MTAKVILNPYAGRWNALKRRPEAEAALQSAGIVYEIVQTEGHGHGEALAEQAVKDGFSPIISAGGDGSISEVVNGMMKAGVSCQGLNVPLGILPLGTANDLVVNLKLPLDLPGAAAVIGAGKTRCMDLGLVIADPNGPARRERYFDNNSAVGLEPTVTLIQQKITRVRGVARYLLATLKAVMQKPAWHMRVEWEGGSYEGPTSLVTVGNHALTGGLFYMTPHADAFDGKLSFVYGFMATRRRILQLLPRTMKPGAGSYVEHPAIHEIHSPWLKIYSQQPTPLHADGEIQSEAVHEIEYCVVPGKLAVLLNVQR